MGHGKKSWKALMSKVKVSIKSETKASQWERERKMYKYCKGRELSVFADNYFFSRKFERIYSLKVASYSYCFFKQSQKFNSHLFNHSYPHSNLLLCVAYSYP